MTDEASPRPAASAEPAAAAAGRFALNEDWAATVLGLVLLALVLTGIIPTGLIP
ncbi:hypothetical protein [Micromonospora sp. NBC_01813]|uniref:hypothetical protein n=1 Tax=Micromonospora sp. NBC_01813 TaxID=2975988 RepID=UPI002DD9B608|nr:hypothetical protein [Micromonospora sp. NBC_01813]WSA09212.1 hypothetical protein OG958_34580 [Micromonospora sp. NBC_01813]